jgi:FtsP/CotA-like multicopper oxidase with cupredoxin domain
MKASLTKGIPHGYEVGYRSFTINGRMLGHGEPIRVKQGERILFHILNGSATEIRSLALPGNSFEVVALDGNFVPNPIPVPALWLGTAERVSAIVHMIHPGVWILGDLADDDRRHGMGSWWNTQAAPARRSGLRLRHSSGTTHALGNPARLRLNRTRPSK